MATQDVQLPHWALELTSQPPAPATKLTGVLDPPGFSSDISTVSKKDKSKSPAPAPRKQLSEQEMGLLKLKKAWEVAFAPAKSLPMNAIMMYMSGNTLQVFSVMMVWTLFKTPITALMEVNNAFVPYETPSTKNQFILVKIVYILTNLVALALGIWKVNGMGLLPTTRSDWLAWEEPQVYAESTIFTF